MGFPYGADEDAAYMVSWLELNHLNGIKSLSSSIKKIDKKYDGKINIKEKEFDFNLINSSALMKGPGIIDYLHFKFKNKKKIDAIINNCSEPEFFIPLLNRIVSNKLFVNLIYFNKKNEKILCEIKVNSLKIGKISNKINIKKNQVKISISNKYEKLILKKIDKKITNNSIQNNLSESLKPENKYWKIIEKIANRTFVPESKESRSKGAGGKNDND